MEDIKLILIYSNIRLALFSFMRIETAPNWSRDAESTILISP